MKNFASILSIILTVIVIRFLTPVINKYLNRPDVQKRKIAKAKLPQWFRGLEFFLFITFYVAIVVFGTIHLFKGNSGEIQSFYELIGFLLFLITVVPVAGLLCNSILVVVSLIASHYPQTDSFIFQSILVFGVTFIIGKVAKKQNSIRSAVKWTSIYIGVIVFFAIQFEQCAEKVFGLQVEDDITAYLTITGRFPYSFEKKYFYVSAKKSNANATAMHELWHFYTYRKFGHTINQISPNKFNDVKEALTVLLNIECADLLNGEIDNGYPQHQQLRKTIFDVWIKTHDIEEVWKIASIA